MKRKRKTSFISLATTIAILAGSITLTSSAADIATSYEIYTHVSGGSQPYEVCTSSAVWLGGGKNTLANGSTTDAKSVKLSLFAIEDGKYYDITEAKSTKWLSAYKEAKIDPNSGKAVRYSDDESDNIAKVSSKGVVTAGKTTGTATVFAFPNVVKNPATKAFSSGTPQKVNVTVKQAAQMIHFYDDFFGVGDMSSSGETTKHGIITKLDVIYGDETYVGVRGDIKGGKFVEDDMPPIEYFLPADKDCTYTASVKDSDKDYVSFSYRIVSTGSDGRKRAEWSKPCTYASGLSPENIYSLAIYGDGIRNDTTTKTALTVTNEQSGKKGTLMVNVLPYVTWSDIYAMEYPVNSPLSSGYIKDDKYGSKPVVIANLTGSYDKAGFAQTEVDITKSLSFWSSENLLQANIAPKQKPKIFVTEGYPRCDIDYTSKDFLPKYDHYNVYASSLKFPAYDYSKMGKDEGNPIYSGLKVAYKCGRDADGKPKATLTFTHPQRKLDDIPSYVIVSLCWPDDIDYFEVSLQT